MSNKRIYIIGALLSWVANTGMFYADNLYQFGRSQSHRELLGQTIIMGVIFSPLWPVQVPIVFCLTGFAEHGWTLNPNHKWESP